MNELSWRSQLNVRCDQIASAILKTVEHQPTVTMFPASRVLLDINGSTITHHHSSQIRRAYSRRQSKEYLTRHYGWGKQFDKINWEMIHATYMQLPFHKRLFITKWVNRLLPFNQRRYKRELFPTPYCPSWCQCIENEDHFLSCTHQSRQDHKAAFKSIISKEMEKIG